MTKLSSIPDNHLALKCEACGKNSMLAVKALLDTLDAETTVHEVIPKLHCSRCKTKGRASFVITYVGHSGEAMLGARQGD